MCAASTQNLAWLLQLVWACAPNAQLQLLWLQALERLTSQEWLRARRFHPSVLLPPIFSMPRAASAGSTFSRFHFGGVAGYRSANAGIFRSKDWALSDTRQLEHF